MTILETAITRSKKLRPRTKELYLQHVRAFLTFIGENRQTDATNGAYVPTQADFTKEAVVDWCEDMRRRRIKAQSINVALNALRYAAQRAECEAFVDGVPRLPVRRRKSPTQDKAERALTWAEGKKLVGTCSGNRGRDLRDNAIITLGLRTGMLRFSMCQLTFGDVKPQRRLTFIKKGGEQHTIKLDETTYTALRAWVEWLVERDEGGGSLFRSLGRQRVSPDVDVSIGQQLTPDGLYRALRERAKEAGFSDLRPHVFRKTFLAWAKRAGAKPSQIEAVTGHTSDGVGDNNDDDGTGEPANMLLPSWDDDFK